MLNQSIQVIEQLEKLHRHFELSLPNKLQSIELLWQNVKTQAVNYGDNVDALYRSLHSLAGSAGAFKQENIGQIARQIEIMMQQRFNGTNSLDNETIDMMDNELQRLKQMIINLSK